MQSKRPSPRLSASCMPLARTAIPRAHASFLPFQASDRRRALLGHVTSRGRVVPTVTVGGPPARAAAPPRAAAVASPPPCRLPPFAPPSPPWLPARPPARWCWLRPGPLLAARQRGAPCRRRVAKRLAAHASRTAATNAPRRVVDVRSRGGDAPPGASGRALNLSRCFFGRCPFTDTPRRLLCTRRSAPRAALAGLASRSADAAEMRCVCGVRRLRVHCTPTWLGLGLSWPAPSQPERRAKATCQEPSPFRTRTSLTPSCLLPRPPHRPQSAALRRRGCARSPLGVAPREGARCPCERRTALRPEDVC